MGSLSGRSCVCPRRDATIRAGFSRQGELQRSGSKYEYRYFDVKGEKRSIYSWKLVSTDKVPKGKRECRALRDMVKEIRRDVEDGINSYQAYRTSLNRFFDDYIETKYELKPLYQNQL